MAKFNPPESFSFDKPTEWTDWKRRFERYRTATELNKKSGEVQVCSLVYAMGSEAENIFKSFTFTDPGHQNNYNIVMEKFDEYFFPRRNVIHERAVFHQRVQRPGEPAETFIRALYDLSEHCEFGEGRDENIRDRIVVGIQDKEQSRKLQLMADLTLAQTIQSVRQSETVNMQISAQAAEAMAATASVQEVRGAHEYKMAAQRRESGKDGAREEVQPVWENRAQGSREMPRSQFSLQQMRQERTLAEPVQNQSGEGSNRGR